MPVIACTSTAANITVITGGIVVFGDALAGGVLLAVQIVAFALVAVAALVTPARSREGRHGVATLSGLRRVARRPRSPRLRRSGAGRAAPARVLAVRRCGSALAGDLAIFTRGCGVIRRPDRRRPAAASPHVSGRGPAALAASATSRGHRDRSGELERRPRQVFTGPPSGPWTAARCVPRDVRAPGRRRPAVHARAREHDRLVIGDRARPRPAHCPLPDGPRCGRRRLRRRSRRPYATDDAIRRARLAHGGAAHRRRAARPIAASIDLRDDGRAARRDATTASSSTSRPEASPAGSRAQRGNPRFAGEHIVFIRGPRAPRLRVIEPSGRVRAFGVPTTRLGDFTTDGTRVLWEANGCLLVAPVTDRDRRARPDPGPCPRSELTLGRRARTRGSARTIPVTLRCVAAPRTCRGTFRLRAEGAASPRRGGSRSPRDARGDSRSAQRARVSRAVARSWRADDGALGDDPARGSTATGSAPAARQSSSAR